ncbi:hypothetical protein D3C71_814760 [compost metagenome]
MARRRLLRHVVVVPQVLLRIRHRELQRIGAARQQLGLEAFQRHAVAAALGEHVHEHLGLHAGALRAGRGLAQQRHGAQRHEVVQQLHRMARAHIADVRDVLGKAAQQRQARGQHLGVAAHQQVQAAFGGLLGGAGHRRVEEAAALGEHGLRDLGGGGGHGGGAVDHHGAGAQRAQRAVVAQHHGLDLRRAGDAQDQHIDLRGQRGHVFDRRGAGLQQVVDRLVARVLQHRELVAVLDDVAGDAVAHQADADEADFARGLWLLFSGGHEFIRA